MRIRRLALVASVAAALLSDAHGAFHLMQIEQLIGGVNGNTAAQAVTLRMRFGGQNQLNGTSIFAWDANGQNPISLYNFTAASGFGERILLTSSAFNLGMAAVPNYQSDYTLTNTIPASYLTGGRITFSNASGTAHIWSLAFGAYTGSNAGLTDNDVDGNYGPAFPNPLPTNTREGIRFTGPADAMSTSNSADYALTPNPASVINNAGQSFTVVPEPGSVALVAFGALALGGSIFSRRRNRSHR